MSPIAKAMRTGRENQAHEPIHVWRRPRGGTQAPSQDNYPKEEIDQLEAELLEMALSTSNTSDIEWELRHIVLEKTMGVVFQKR